MPLAYFHEVLAANDGAQALAILSRQWFPVVVTDRNMPGLDGLEFTSRLRALATAPTYVIMVTGSDDPAGESAIRNVQDSGDTLPGTQAA